MTRPGLDCPLSTLVIVTWHGPTRRGTGPRRMGVGVYLGPHEPRNPEYDNLSRIDLLWMGRVATFESSTGVWRFEPLYADNPANEPVPVV